MSISESRRACVDAARQAWIGRLIDTSRRNNLLYFRPLKAGTLDLSSAEEPALRDLLDGEKVALRRLVPLHIDPGAGLKLRDIARKAQSNLEEKGLDTLHAAFGMATWPSEDDGRPTEAAVVLLPVVAEGARADPESLSLRSAGPPQANIALLHYLAEAHGVCVLEEEFIAAATNDNDRLDPELGGDFLRRAAARVRGFEVRSQAVLGNFSFQKLAMVRDLRECADLLAAHDMVAALSGDTDARSSLGGRRVAIEPRDLDTVPPEREFMVLDADSSQQAVVHSVAADLDGVIQGPPGCGKSQTIANSIATLVAQGKRVLFVAEKRAALEAVFKRLDEKGLGHLALDLHGAGVSPTIVMAKVASALDAIRHAAVPDDAEVHQRFEDRRSRVVAHMEYMHRRTPPSGLTPYELQNGILETAKGTPSRTRWRGPALSRLGRDAYEQVLDLLKEALGVSALLLRTAPSGWTHAELRDGSEAQAALDTAGALAHEHLPELLRNLAALADMTSFARPSTIDEAERALTLVVDTNAFLSDWEPGIFEDHSAAADLGPAGRGLLSALWAMLTSSQYRSAKRRTAHRSLAGATAPRSLLEGALAANAIAERWRALSAGSSVPRMLDIAGGAMEALRLVASDLAVLGEALPNLRSLSLELLSETASSLASDQATAHSIPSVRRIEAQLDRLGAGALVAELRASSVPPQSWSGLFRHAYYSSCYDAARALIPELAAFSGCSHGSFVEEFRTLDRDRLRIAAGRVIREHAERAIDAMNTRPEQTLMIRAQAAKKRSRMTLRALVGQAAEVLTSVCPCWMLSPLNVSQLLPADRQYFDVVVFDEASQVPPEDAVCSVLRGKRLVVAGDRHQLPPTTFFADGSEEESEDAPTAGYESLLDQMSAFADHWPLEWHYRSQDERLIAFSNRHVYGDRLTTFPGTGSAPAISHILVDAQPRDGEEDSCSAEVERVVATIITHAEEQFGRNPNDQETLGVIAFGIKHSTRIQVALDRAVESKPHLAEFLDTSTGNPCFFLKNLERVQGDERDVIILSVGYGKDHRGRLVYRFGPLLSQGGERRLNVAITRAKRRMVVVSSFSHTDMDPRRSSGEGVALLRLFLQFAASGGTDLGDTGVSGAPLNAFESDIYDCLTGRGIPLVSQYGVSGYRLDFAALHPSRKGQFVLAIECDGASYHSAPTARDRDRLRQQQLERIGWRFHRIWSTDWFLRREEEIERAVQRWKDAVVAADSRWEEEKERKDQIGGLFGMCPAPTGNAEGADPARASEQRTGQPPRVCTFTDLVSLVRWICSDGMLRTDDEIIGEVLPLIGYQRRGSRIVQAITLAIRRATAEA